MKTSTKILVVDDDLNLRKTLVDILRVKDYETVAAGTGREAISAADLEPIALALIDLKLPDMSGIQVMEHLKAKLPLLETIILTGHASMDTAIEAINKGAFSYLLKPYQIADLLLHIRHATERRRAQEEIGRLASYPQLDPNPIIEINSQGEVTYLNPAAEKHFPDLRSMGHGHTLLTGLENAAALFEREGRKEMVREVAIGALTYEEHLSLVPDSDLVRAHVLDVTERKNHEIRIEKTDTLLLTIRRINEHLLVAESEDELYRFICTTLMELGHVVGVWIGLKMPDFSVQAVGWAGFDDATVAGFDARWDEAGSGCGVMGAAIREGRPVIVQDTSNDPRYASWSNMLQRWNIRSVIGVPLIADGDVIGSVTMFSALPAVLNDDTVGFLADIAADTALGVRALRLDKRLHATLNSLRKGLDGTVEAIARMVELRDPYTAGHERRVAYLSCAIGKELGFPERLVEGLRIAGYLHDIGKIAVPAEILSKPSKLTEFEYGIIRGHAQVGYDILQNLDFPWPVAQAVLQHHERLDGSGYPNGASAGDIILEARVLMVADVVEAMSGHRPYRPALGVETALKEINANKGRTYDVDVVDACTRLFVELGFNFQGKS